MSVYLQTAIEDAAAFDAPPERRVGAAIEGYGSDPTGSACATGPQAGAAALLAQLAARFGGRGEIFACRPVRGASRLSLHGEGRAVDWFRNVNDPLEAAEAQRIIDWLLAADGAGNAHALARRMGVQEVIWNRRIWTARRHGEGWRAYTGVNPHTDHLHIGLSWAGARMQTSYWAAGAHAGAQAATAGEQAPAKRPATHPAPAKSPTPPHPPAARAVALVYQPQAHVAPPVAVQSHCRAHGKVAARVLERGVLPARLLPAGSADSAAAVQAALAAAGLSAAQRKAVNVSPLQPLGRVFGAPALTELLARLHWGPKLIASYGRGPKAVLAVRLLLHIPGHFRELARRAPDARDAHALESIGWLLQADLASDIHRATAGKPWWTPPAPAFVTGLPDPLPPLSAELQGYVRNAGLLSAAIRNEDYVRCFTAWEKGLAGRQWALETRGPQPGRAFCPELVTVPVVQGADVDAGRKRTHEAWTARVAAAGGPFPAGKVTAEIIKAADGLRRCIAGPPGLFAPASSGGLALSEPKEFPAREGSSVHRSLQVLPAVKPLFEGVMRAAAELGWNDLLYATAGAGCYRGTKLPPHEAFKNPTEKNMKHPRVAGAVRAAQRMSNHAVGVAVDLNDFENTQDHDRPLGSMDPRIVALFQAFGFRWGACLPVPDPMHFEVDEAALPRPAKSPAPRAKGSPR